MRVPDSVGAHNLDATLMASGKGAQHVHGADAYALPAAVAALLKHNRTASGIELQGIVGAGIHADAAAVVGVGKAALSADDAHSNPTLCIGEGIGALKTGGRADLAAQVAVSTRVLKKIEARRLDVERSRFKRHWL
jgi:hypothetical protein